MEYLQYKSIEAYLERMADRVLNLIINGIPSILKGNVFINDYSQSRF